MTQVEIENALKKLAYSGGADSASIDLRRDGSFAVYRYDSGDEDSLEQLATGPDIGSALADAVNEAARLDATE